MKKKAVEKLAKKYEVSADAVHTLEAALMRGNGTMAQFNHPELGGQGQWVQGGMTMIGDMFNDALKAKVNRLCSEIAPHVKKQVDDVRPSDGAFQHQSQWQQPSIRSEEPDKRTYSKFRSAATDSAAWWPKEFGSPTATGAQNNMRYAYFAKARRLVVELGGQVAVYDTLDHTLTGVSQQQSTTQSIKFTSQHGLVDLAELPIISHSG